MKARFFSILLVAAAAGLAGAEAAVPGLETASPRGETVAPPRHIQMAQDFVPLETVLAKLESRYSGHQLSVSGPSRAGNRYVYRIKWLTEDGAVLYVVADAETGAILSVEGG